MMSNKTTGRLAGLAYLGVVLTGFFSLAYAPSQLIDMKDAAKTLANIAASEQLFRFGIVAGFACYIFFLVLPVILFKVFEPYGRIMAGLMVAFAAASVPIAFIALTHKLAILQLVDQADVSVNAVDVAAQLMERLREYKLGISVATIFWGLWLFPLGFLVAKSGAIPRFLGAFLMLGCFGYLANFSGPLLWPAYDSTMLRDIVDKPATIGELGTCLWLLVMGARDKR